MRVSDRHLMLHDVAAVLFLCFLAGMGLTFREHLSAGTLEGITHSDLIAGGMFSGMLAVLVFSVLLRRQEWVENIEQAASCTDAAGKQLV